MAHILHIDSSPRGDRSHSRKLSHEFITGWKTAHPEDTLSYRDIGRNPVPHVDEPWIAGAYSPPEAHTPELSQALKISDELVDEFIAADRYVFGVPMYNFSVPSTFKAYIDQIARVNRTFAVSEQGYQGLVNGKKMLVITASGGSRQRLSAAGYDFQEPFLRAVFGFVGVTDITFIHADNLSGGDGAAEQSISEVRTALQSAVDSW